MMNTTAWIKRRYYFLTAFAVISLLIVFIIFRLAPNQNGTREGIVTETFTVQEGWGYQVIVNGKVFIYQPFIPGNNKIPFPSEEVARNAAQLVKDKLRSGETPNLTREELEEIGAL